MKRYSALCGGLAALLITGITALALTFAGGRAASADEVGGGGDFIPGVIAERNGDTNADGVRDMSDAVALLSYLYLGGPAPRPLACEPNATFHNGDVNGSGVIELADAIWMLNWLFKGGRAPLEGCPFGG